MSLVPTVYESTDAGAPQLSGQPGSLTALLDAVLVDGYGVGAGRKAGAGWTREFSASNVRVYRGNVVSGNGYHLRIDDSATAGNARHAWMRGYERMSAASVGENPVPGVGQRANGTIVPKSLTIDGAARRWRVIANERFFYIFIDTAGKGCFHPSFAGDAISFKPGDAHAFVVSAVSGDSWNGEWSYTDRLFSTNTYVANTYDASCGLFVARSHNGAVGAVACDHFGLIQGLTYGGQSGGAFPSGINQGLLHEPARFTNGAYAPRGELPGMIAPLQTLLASPIFADGAILEGVEGVSGRILVTKFSKSMNVDDSWSYMGVALHRLDSEWV